MIQSMWPRSKELFSSSRTTSGPWFAMERPRPGFLSKWRFAKNPMTAGRLGKKFENAVNESNDLAPPLTSTLKEAPRTFVELANERNELVHAHVYSKPDGRQQLIYQGKDKTKTLVDCEDRSPCSSIRELFGRPSRFHEGNLRTFSCPV